MHSIVILGGGYAGVAAATSPAGRLRRRAEVRITLASRSAPTPRSPHLFGGRRPATGPGAESVSVALMVVLETVHPHSSSRDT
jgi:NADH dehydrogenase FAD-containing subunit